METVPASLYIILVNTYRMPTKYFEDLEIGEVYKSGGYTITKPQIIEFAMKFDPQPFHIDEVAANKSMFNGIIASGIHTFGICQRLATEAFYEDSAFLFGRGVNDLRFSNPTYPEDTISVTVMIIEKIKQYDYGGQVDIRIEGHNQDGEEIASWTALAVIGYSDETNVSTSQ